MSKLHNIHLLIQSERGEVLGELVWENEHTRAQNVKPSIESAVNRWIWFGIDEFIGEGESLRSRTTRSSEPEFLVRLEAYIAKQFHFRLRLTFVSGIQEAQGANYMTTKIRPLSDRIIVKRLEADSTSKGGIIIPENAKEKPARGEVLAVGPGRTLNSGELTQVGVGDRVIFERYAGVEVEFDGEKYLVVKAENILGVFEEG